MVSRLPAREGPLSDNLDKLTGRHALDFTEAKDEARRAIFAKLDGRDPKGIIPSDDPTLSVLLAEYLRERSAAGPWRSPVIEKTLVSGRPFGEWRISRITDGHDPRISTAPTPGQRQP